MKPPHRRVADIPPTLLSTGAVGFWAAVILTGAGAGIGAVALTTLLEKVQQFMWPGPGTASPSRLGEAGIFRS